MKSVLEWDKGALLWINGHHNLFLDAILLPVSLAGEYGAIWIVASVALLIWGKSDAKKTALLFCLTALFVDRCIAGPLGELVPRERPYLALEGIRQLGVPWRTNSFPSGHAHSVWIATVLLGSRWRRLRLPLVVFAVLTCYARPYLGMHYPLDVLAGSAIGIAAGFGVVGVERLWQRRGRKRET